MKRFLLLTLIILSCLTGMLLAQDWEIVKQGDLTKSVINGFFLDSNKGWIILNDDVILKTTDGGTIWTVAKDTDGSGVDWNDIEFANADVGYACTDDGFIYKTIDGGFVWTAVESGNYTGDFEGVSVVDENTVYVCGDDSLLLKTTNGGSNFTKITYDFQGEDLDGGVAFVDANVGVVISDGNSGSTWYTHDGGDTWEYVQLTFPPGTISKRLYAVSGAGDSTVVVSGYHYCNFVSTDGGKTYALSGDYTYGFDRFTSVDVVDENIIVSGGSAGHVRKTTDGGATWDTLKVGTGQTVEFVDFIDADNGYVILNAGQWMKTSDGGVTWMPLRDWPGISFWGLALPEDDKIVLTAWGGGEMSMSMDGGMTWIYPTNLATGTPDNLYECEFGDASNGLIAGSYGTLKKTTDGGQIWTIVDNPMYQGTNLHINALRYVNEDFVLGGGSKGSIMKSLDGGETWEILPNDESKTVYDIFPISDTQVIASASSGQIYLSTAAVDSFYLAKDYGSNSMRAVEFRGDVGLVAASSGALFRTTVADWDTLVEVFTEPDGDDFYDVEFITDSLVYVVGENGKIYKSEDAGITWMQETQLTESTLQKVRYRNYRIWAVGQDGTILKLDMTPETPVSGLLINEFMADNDNVLADDQGDYDDWFEIFNSNDFDVDIGGLYITDDLSDPAAWQIPAGKPDSTTIPAGGFLMLWADKDTEDGVLHCDIKLSAGGEQLGLVQMIGEQVHFIDSLTFGEQMVDTSYGRSSDGGMDWTYFSPASPGETNANGTPVAIEFDENQIVYDYDLSQNYPNPFNPTTTIEFAIKKAGKVNLSVYNVAGQKVATLINQKMNAGKGAVTFDATQFASGVYFYQITAGDFKQVKKMLLVK